MARIRNNPRAQAVRKSIDVIVYALATFEVWVNEYTQPDGLPGVEYVIGFGKEAHVVAHWERMHGQNNGVQWVGNNSLMNQVIGLVEGHARIFSTMY